jgi:hypothetical protein
VARPHRPGVSVRPTLPANPRFGPAKTGGGTSTIRVDEAVYRPDHPDFARDLDNLAWLLRDTSRLGEAEPPMRRHLSVFPAFQRDAGHARPHRDAAIEKHTANMGPTQSAIITMLQTMREKQVSIQLTGYARGAPTSAFCPEIAE